MKPFPVSPIDWNSGAIVRCNARAVLAVVQQCAFGLSMA
jgi:hypothetical protein